MKIPRNMEQAKKMGMAVIRRTLFYAKERDGTTYILGTDCFEETAYKWRKRRKRKKP